jgi:hypothetical protein
LRFPALIFGNRSRSNKEGQSTNHMNNETQVSCNPDEYERLLGNWRMAEALFCDAGRPKPLEVEGQRTWFIEPGDSGAPVV